MPAKFPGYVTQGRLRSRTSECVLVTYDENMPAAVKAIRWMPDQAINANDRDHDLLGVALHAHAILRKSRNVSGSALLFLRTICCCKKRTSCCLLVHLYRKTKYRQIFQICAPEKATKRARNATKKAPCCEEIVKVEPAIEPRAQFVQTQGEQTSRCMV